MTDYILVVHDQAQASRFVSGLRHAGYDVASVYGISACRDAIGRRVPDLILYDALTDSAAPLAEFAALYAELDLGLIPLVVLATSLEIVQDQEEQLGLVDDVIVLPVSLATLDVRLAWRLARSRHVQAAVKTNIDDLRRQMLNFLDPEIMSVLLTIVAAGKSLRAGLTAQDDVPHADLPDVLVHAAEALYRYLQNYLLYLQLSAAGQEAGLEPLRQHLEARAAHDEIARAATEVVQRYGREEDLALDLIAVAVKISRVDLGKIVAELVEQACRLSAPGSTIHVACTQTPVFAIMVSDSRPARANAAAVDELGLALVKLLARSHGGHLTLQQDAGQAGLQATVTFATLPLMPRQDGATAPDA